jgi:tRNA pseudouridine38-40 synthase
VTSATDSTNLPDPPRNILITIEYDGTRFVGWESQRNGPSIQYEMEQAIASITGEHPTLNGSGRTDAGVHAVAQTASFTLLNKISSADLKRALTAVLPMDIAVTDVQDVPLSFHARFSAIAKTYRYRVWNAQTRSPLRRGVSHHVRSPLDIEAIRRAAEHLVGRHDFTSFARDPETRASCVRTIQSLEIIPDGDLVEFFVTGDGFLYNMVRIVVGTLLQVGSGQVAPEDLVAIRDGRDRILAGPTVPACGLSLLRVSYR